MSRIILHSDLNNFYASVECMLNPSLKGKDVAVCGNREDRHGIVLAKNQSAKLKGVKTGEAIWEAQLKCPDLVIVPPRFEEYLKYSRIVKKIYCDYTDLVEPYGMDECWLDVTGSAHLFGSGFEIAEMIRKRVFSETGLTVSVGVSFNKIFAKLGSDMKKPDAVTCINEEDFREMVWNLDVSELLGVGRATLNKLNKYNISTIGELANSNPDFIKRWFGKCGVQLWRFANGKDFSSVLPADCSIPAKSIGHGITCTSDLLSEDEIWRVILELTIDISRKLRLSNKLASGICVSVKNNKLQTKEFMCGMENPTHNTLWLATAAFELLRQKYDLESPVRAVSVRAIRLVDEFCGNQLSFFGKESEKDEKIESAMEGIRSRFGKYSITYATLLQDLKMPKYKDAEIILPSFYHA